MARAKRSEAYRLVERNFNVVPVGPVDLRPITKATRFVAVMTIRGNEVVGARIEPWGGA